MFNYYLRYSFILIILSWHFAVFAETTLVAVASNFAKPMNEIVNQFEKTTGHQVKLSLGSTGKFITQIENGAPFEILLAADEEHPQQLIQSGYAVAQSQFTYALGKLVLWSAIPNLVDAQGQILTQKSFKHLAIADPKLAPYGVAAIETLKQLKLLDQLQPLFVQGENIAQTYQFIQTGNAELGFIALSQVIDKNRISQGSAWIIPETLYTPIRQNAILLNKAEANPAAIALLSFLKSPIAIAIIEKYGYHLPHSIK